VQSSIGRLGNNNWLCILSMCTVRLNEIELLRIYIATESSATELNHPSLNHLEIPFGRAHEAYLDDCT